MLKHIVFIKFKKEATEAEIADMEKGLRSLPSIISEIKQFEFGRDVVHSERSYDFALVSVFADLEAMKHYQVHPNHVQVVGKVKKVAESLLAVDFNY
jgi:hypothetical protein